MRCVPQNMLFGSWSLSHEKKDWKDRTHQTFFLYDTDSSMTLQYTKIIWGCCQKCNLQPSQIILHSRCHTKRRFGRAPPTNSYFAMTTMEIFKDAFLRHMLHVLDLHGSACHASVTLIMFSHARHFAEPSRQLDVIIFTNNLLTM